MRNRWMKIAVLVCVAVAAAALTSCGIAESKSGSEGKTDTSKYDKVVNKAVDCFASTWEDQLTGPDNMGDGHMEIKNTRIIVLKDHPSFDDEVLENAYDEIFGNAGYVVEFIYYCDWFGSAPYYDYVGRNDAVLIKSDGSKGKCVTNPFSSFRSRTYSSDFDPFIDEIIDLGDSYNQTFDF